MENEEIIDSVTNVKSDYPLQKADPEIIPEPTIWPISLAFGMAFIFWGFIAAPGITFIGIVISMCFNSRMDC